MPFPVETLDSRGADVGKTKIMIMIIMDSFLTQMRDTPGSVYLFYFSPNVYYSRL